jgi:serine/threonine protein kinase
VTDGGSGFFVGPREAPESFELIALLGAGGEGEVWQAIVRRPGIGGEVGDEVAIKLARHDPEDQRWPTFADLLTSVSHPALVRVRTVFTGAERHRADELETDETHRYIVMDYEPGLTLSQWSQEHPEASQAERTRLLAPVAAALDALHAGAGVNEPVAHGDVKPGNVIVRPNGSTVLVDLGLIRLTSTPGTPGHTTAYTAPELRDAHAQATTEGDAFAFAVTTAQTLTGQPPPTGPDGYLDTSALARQLRTSPATRRHPLLTWHVMRALDAVPEKRAVLLSAWLRAPRRHLRLVVGAATALLLFGSAIAVAATNHDGSSGQPIGKPSASPFASRSSLGFDAATASKASLRHSPAASTGKSSRPPVVPATLALRAYWNLDPANSCDPSSSYDAVAGAGAFPAHVHSAWDVRESMLKQVNSGLWNSGVVTLELSVGGPGNIRLLSVAAAADPHAAPNPTWIYQPTSVSFDSYPTSIAVCGTSSGRAPPADAAPRAYSFDGQWQADSGALRISAATNDQDDSHQTFQQTVLRPVDTAKIDMSTRACAANYSFRLVIRYEVDGSSHPQTWTSPQVFTIYGKAAGATLYEGYKNQYGEASTEQSNFTGSDRSCAGEAGVTVASPFPKVTPSASSSSATATHTSPTSATPTSQSPSISSSAPPTGSATPTP